VYLSKLAVAVGLVIVAPALLAQTGKPAISAIGNVASYQQGFVSPGEMVVIFGSGMGPSQLVKLQLDTNGRVSTTLSGVQVLFDGTAAPLIYVSQGQIAAMVPFGISGKSATQVQVSYGGAVSNPISESVSATAPGIFSADSSGKGQAAINNSDGSVNSASNPAAPGSYFTLYLTGEGLTNPPGSDGNVATGVANVNASVSVQIAGQTARVLYAGSAPGNVNGFAQVNVVIPTTLPYGGNLPLVVQIGNASSQVGITVAITVATMQSLPAAPTNLSATAASTTQVNLTWVNNAPNATAIRVEYLAPGSATFTDIFAAATLTSTGVINLQPGTTYSFRVRAQNAAGYSGYSNQVTVTTLSSPTLTIFLIHGIGESSSDSSKLAQTLRDPVFGIALTTATIDSGFTWACAKYAGAQCDGSCTIPQGAILLAQYILAHSPPGGRIVLIGHSMGGLLVRDMILNNWLGVISTRTLAAMITLGTPNVGYPFVEGLDDSAVASALGITLCPALGQEMYSDYRTLQSENEVIQSSYLSNLNQRWGTSSLTQQLFAWLAASGTFCTEPTRSIFNPVGCPDSNPDSDGVVCDLSARFLLNIPKNLPTTSWSSNLYAHTSSSTRYVSGLTLLCTTQSLFFDYIPLYDPPAASTLVSAIRNLVNGL
jgi:uncharacterized protein (TIGR03437 family)